MSRFSGKIPLCYLCRQSLAQEWHHIKPKAKGGTDKEHNLIPLCIKCHRGLKLHSNWEAKSIELLTMKFFFDSMDNADPMESANEGSNSLYPMQEPIYKETSEAEILREDLSKPVVDRSKKKVKRPIIGVEQPVRPDVRIPLIPGAFLPLIQCKKCLAVIPCGSGHTERTKVICANCI